MPTEGGFLKSKKNSDNDLSTASSHAATKYEVPLDALDWAEGVKFTDKHVRMYDTCNKYDAHLTKAHFDFIAANYEGMYLRMGYPDPKFVAKYVNK